MSTSNRSIITYSRRSNLPPFRPAPVEIEGADFLRDPDQDFSYRPYAESTFSTEDSVSSQSQIGIPSNLQKVSERRVKKGTSTFIDVFVSFDPAEGAEYHEFRVAKIPLEQDDVS